LKSEEKMKEYEEKLRETTTPPVVHIRGSGRTNLPGLGEASVSGSGLISQEEIRISGSGRLPGGIKTKRIRGSGSVLIEGDAEADEMRFSGSASIAGAVRTKTLSSAGSLKVGRDFKGGVTRFAGSFSIGGHVELDDSFSGSGALKVVGDLKTKNSVDLRGRFQVEGKVATNDFRAELRRGKSHVRDGIEANNVTVEKGEVIEGIVIFGFPIFGGKLGAGRLETTSIVASDKVAIENVFCDQVTGNDVDIGEGCEVRGRVKYSGTVHVHPKSKLANPPEKITRSMG